MPNKLIVRICKIIHRLTYRYDKRMKRIQLYEYETAPYCGHHYNGWYGKYNYAGFHEGDGQSFAHIKLWRFWITATHHTEEGWSLHLHYVRRKVHYAQEWGSANDRRRVVITIHEFFKWRWVKRTNNHYARWFLPHWFLHDKKYKLSDFTD